MSDDFRDNHTQPPCPKEDSESVSGEPSATDSAEMPQHFIPPQAIIKAEPTPPINPNSQVTEITGEVTTLPSCGFVTEKNVGKGEDSEPIEFHWENEGGRKTLLAVFDGMGGAGSRKVPDLNNPDTIVSMAYLASRSARTAVVEACNQITPKMQPSEVVEILNDHIQKSLQRLVSREGGNPETVMRGSMVKNYPTTVAIAIIEERESRSVHMMWAGDSRVYAIWPNQDFLLQQLTQDHTASGTSSDGGDAALTRCATPDSVNLEYVNVDVPLDAIVFVATDGCFAYESSQFFLTSLIEQLDRSSNEEQYSKNLAQVLSTVAGDDCSMAMSFPPNLDFDSVKADFQKHLRHLQDIRNVPRNNPFITLSSDDFFLKHLQNKTGV